MASSSVTAPRSAPAPASLGQTDRKDRWWVGPLATAMGLGLFGIYATYRAFIGAEFEYGHGATFVGAIQNNAGHAYLLSPFYSPLFAVPGWLPTWVSPAMFILWAPGGFRLTCYYYRKAYYRAFFADPPGCSVGEGRKNYSGETRLFLFQNLHRYFLYVALIFLVLLAIDVVHAMIWHEGNSFGISVGTLVLIANLTLLSLYTISCHSFRHLIGGNVDCYSCVKFGAQRQQAWKKVSWLNKRHMLFAWTSLFMVGFADFYVWMVSRGTFTDIRLI